MGYQFANRVIRTVRDKMINTPTGTEGISRRADRHDVPVSRSQAAAMQTGLRKARSRD